MVGRRGWTDMGRGVLRFVMRISYIDLEHTSKYLLDICIYTRYSIASTAIFFEEFLILEIIKKKHKKHPALFLTTSYPHLRHINDSQFMIYICQVGKIHS